MKGQVQASVISALLLGMACFGTYAFAQTNSTDTSSQSPQDAGSKAADQSCPQEDATHKYLGPDEGFTVMLQENGNEVKVSNLSLKDCEDKGTAYFVIGRCISSGKCLAHYCSDAAGQKVDCTDISVLKSGYKVTPQPLTSMDQALLNTTPLANQKVNLEMNPYSSMDAASQAMDTSVNPYIKNDTQSLSQSVQNFTERQNFNTFDAPNQIEQIQNQTFDYGNLNPDANQKTVTTQTLLPILDGNVSTLGPSPTAFSSTYQGAQVNSQGLAPAIMTTLDQPSQAQPTAALQTNSGSTFSTFTASYPLSSNVEDRQQYIEATPPTFTERVTNWFSDTGSSLANTFSKLWGGL